MIFKSWSENKQYNKRIAIDLKVGDLIKIKGHKTVFRVVRLPKRYEPYILLARPLRSVQNDIGIVPERFVNIFKEFVEEIK